MPPDIFRFNGVKKIQKYKYSQEQKEAFLKKRSLQDIFHGLIIFPEPILS
jgi:hypothetical protein